MGDNAAPVSPQLKGEWVQVGKGVKRRTSLTKKLRAKIVHEPSRLKGVLVFSGSFFLTTLVLIVAIGYSYIFDNIRNKDPDGSFWSMQDFDELVRLPAHVGLEGEERYFFLDFPTNYDQEDSDITYPVIISLHGLNSGPHDAKTAFGGDASGPHNNGFIMAYPAATKLGNSGRHWNAGTCCGPAAENDVDDVAFIDAMITYIIDNYRGDWKLIYLEGISTGAHMTYRLVCELGPNTIRAAAPMHGSLLNKIIPERCQGNETHYGLASHFDSEACTFDDWESFDEKFSCVQGAHVPMLTMQGGRDLLNPEEGIFTGPFIQKWFGVPEITSPPTSYVSRHFAKMNYCDKPGSFSLFWNDRNDFTKCEHLPMFQCPDSVNITRCWSKNAGHNRYGSTTRETYDTLSYLYQHVLGPFTNTFDMNEHILQFFNKHDSRYDPYEDE